MIAEELRQAIRVLKDARPAPARDQPNAEGLAQHGASGAARARAAASAERRIPASQAIVELLPELYRDCKGNAVRIGEILKDTHRIEIAYSTLTRLIREHTDLRTPKKRSGTYTFGPGEEMQHDTSPHRLTLGGKKVKAQCASLILAYCRMLFIAYYPRFTRFEAKAFLSRGAAVLRRGRPALCHRQHQRHPRRGLRCQCPDRPGDGGLRRAVRV